MIAYAATDHAVDYKDRTAIAPRPLPDFRNLGTVGCASWSPCNGG